MGFLVGQRMQLIGVCAYDTTSISSKENMWNQVGVSSAINSFQDFQQGNAPSHG